MQHLIGKTIANCTPDDNWLRLTFTDETSARLLFWGVPPLWIESVRDVFGRRIRSVERAADHWVLLFDDWSGFSCVFPSDEVPWVELYASPTAGQDDATGDFDHPLSAAALERVLNAPMTRLRVCLLEGTYPPIQAKLLAHPEGECEISGATEIVGTARVASCTKRSHRRTDRLTWTEVTTTGNLPPVDWNEMRLRLGDSSSAPGAIAWPGRFAGPRRISTRNEWKIEDKVVTPQPGDVIEIARPMVRLSGVALAVPSDVYLEIRDVFLAGAMYARGGIVHLQGCWT